MRWYRVRADGRDYVLGDDGTPVQADLPTPAERVQTAVGTVGKANALLAAAVDAFWFSLESVLLFAEKVGVPDFIGYLRWRDHRLAAVGGGRMLVGVEALLGVGYLVLTIRMMVTLGGG